MPAAIFFGAAAVLFSAGSALAAPDALNDYDPAMFMASFRVICGLFLVIGIIFALYAFARRQFNFLPGSSATAIKIVEARHLMPRKSIYLIEVRGREYLIGVTDQNINLLSSQIKTDSFAELLDDAVEDKS